jgi:hypothetical protein
VCVTCKCIFNSVICTVMHKTLSCILYMMRFT